MHPSGTFRSPVGGNVLSESRSGSVKLLLAYWILPVSDKDFGEARGRRRFTLHKRARPQRNQLGGRCKEIEA